MVRITKLTAKPNQTTPKDTDNNDNHGLADDVIKLFPKTPKVTSFDRIVNLEDTEANPSDYCQKLIQEQGVDPDTTIGFFRNGTMCFVYPISIGAWAGLAKNKGPQE